MRYRVLAVLLLSAAAAQADDRVAELWNGKARLPACTALKRAPDFVRSPAQWKHPYWWAGWQLWAARDPEEPEKGDG